MARTGFSAGEQVAFIHAKNAIKCGAHRLPAEELPVMYRSLKFHAFTNEKGGRNMPEPLPDPPQGFSYIACDLGEDQKGGRGIRRLVFECHDVHNEWAAVYYTNDHYAKGTFFIVENR